MRRTVALVLAVPAAIALLAPSPATPAASFPVVETVIADATATSDDAVSSSPPAPTSPAPPTPAPASPAPAPPAPPSLPGSGAGAATSDGGSAAPPEPVDPGTPTTEPTFVVAPVPEAGGMAGSGPLWRYSVEVEPSIGVDPVRFAEEVRAALHDPRSWARDRTMQQVADPARARIRVVLAAPPTVDDLCGRVGLDTAGIYSCWTGRFALLNAWRWDAGAEGFPDLATYRTYLVNHEVGHGLGFGHVGCPAPEALAPVMMQQSMGLDACVANGWPHP